ncbi:zinc finger BED domain-containing protein 4-like [Alosa pseudoharengus]|uniref:zinc finger BED domain-containing protein 4-like n=1 Tax=Alosa pseudoharengus TaxID=34774 RepID=UPI003F886352
MRIPRVMSCQSRMDRRRTDDVDLRDGLRGRDRGRYGRGRHNGTGRDRGQYWRGRHSGTGRDRGRCWRGRHSGTDRGRYWRGRPRPEHADHRYDNRYINESFNPSFEHVKPEHGVMEKKEIDLMRGDCSESRGHEGTITDTKSGVCQTASRRISTDTSVAHETHKKKRGDKIHLKSEVLKMIVKDLHPPHLVEEAGFRALVQALMPSSQMPPTGSWARSQLKKMYEDKKVEVINTLHSTEHVVLTAEMWQRSTETHLTVSCHFLDDKWTRKSYILETARVMKGHSVASIVARIARSWGIEKKIHVVVSNLPNVKEPFQKRGWHEMPCFAHILDTMFETATKFVWGDQWRDLLTKCSNVLDYISGNQEAMQNFKEHQGILPLYWPLDEKWPSIFNLLEWILGQINAIKASLISQAKSEMWISPEDEQKLIKALAVLRVFSDAMHCMKNGYHSVSEIIPLLLELHSKLRQFRNEIGIEIVKKCEKHIINMKQSRWLTFSTVLDPRFKMFHFLDQIESRKDNIANEMSTVSHQGKSYSGLKLDLNHLRSVLDDYVREDPLSMEKDPLEFWKLQKQFTSLTPLARKYLTVVSTALPYERALRPDVYIRENMKRGCIQPEDIDMMLFLQGNLTVG